MKLTQFRGRLRTDAQIEEKREQEKAKKKLRLETRKINNGKANIPGYSQSNRNNPYAKERGLTRSVVSKVKSKVLPEGDTPDSSQGLNQKAASELDTNIFYSFLPIQIQLFLFLPTSVIQISVISSSRHYLYFQYF